MTDEGSPPTADKTSDTFHVPDRTEMIETICKDYAQYLELDASSENKQFGDSVEDMLTHLDEFCSVLDLIRGDSSLCLNETLPKIQKKCDEMQKVFDKIDRLETFVSMVRENVSAMEECISKAEDEMGSFSGLKKMLSSFVGPKKSQTKEPRKPSAFNPPDIFSTGDFFPQNDQNISENPNNSQKPVEPSGATGQ